MSRTNELKMIDKSLTYDDVRAFEKPKKRESLPIQHKRNEQFSSNFTKKNNSS